MVKLLFSVMCILMSVSGFAQEHIKIKHGPYLQNLKETEVTIVWLSNPRARLIWQCTPLKTTLPHAFR